MMERRELFALGGAATILALPHAAPAQTVHRVGLLSPGPAIGDASFLGVPLIKGLAARGHVPGRNLVFERRGAHGHREDLPRLVTELAAAKAEAIFVTGYFPALAAKAGTVPVVAINAGDPVGTGLIASLARPGGNVTGISDVSAELTPKRMELLKALVPGLKRLAILFNAEDAGMTLRYRATETVAKAMGIEIMPLGVREPEEFDVAFRAMDASRPDAILMVTDVLTMLNRKRVMDYAAARKLPAIYEFDDLVRAGGLMSYGPDLDETMARVAVLIDRILKGAKPADLPFEQPTRFKLALNLKTAQALGLELPRTLLSIADDIIE